MIRKEQIEKNATLDLPGFDFTGQHIRSEKISNFIEGLQVIPKKLSVADILEFGD